MIDIMTGESGEYLSEDPRRKTIETYDRQAEALAEYYASYEARVGDIELAFRLAGNPKNAKVLEIGCGSGRDGQAIAERTNAYVGIDPSAGMLRVARKNAPDVDFIQADASSYRYPNNLDIVFAFASLLHVDEGEMQLVLEKVHGVLRPGGIFFMSLKFAKDYHAERQDDTYGTRVFYYYRPKKIKELAGDGYETVYQERSEHGGKQWFETALRKKS
jgi:SAM-dependent methyltransferase